MVPVIEEARQVPPNQGDAGVFAFVLQSHMADAAVFFGLIPRYQQRRQSADTQRLAPRKLGMRRVRCLTFARACWHESRDSQSDHTLLLILEKPCWSCSPSLIIGRASAAQLAANLMAARVGSTQ